MISEIDVGKCTGCGLCVEFCPMDVLRLDASSKAYIAYPQSCMTCYNCELECPAQAVNVNPFRKKMPDLIRYP